MAQGNLKKKVKLPVGAKQKKQHIKKQSGVRKGRTYVLMVCVDVPKTCYFPNIAQFPCMRCTSTLVAKEFVCKACHIQNRSFEIIGFLSFIVDAHDAKTNFSRVHHYWIR